MAAVAVLLPRVSGSTWQHAGLVLTHVSPVVLIALAALWLTGLVAHTLTLTGALPGLTHRRALTLSLTGSAVSNVLPLGGAVGIALNRSMTRAWGHDDRSFVAYTVVTNVWDVVTKLALPLLLLPLLLVSRGSLATGLLPLGVVAPLAGLAVVVLLAWRAPARAVARALDALGRRLRPGTSWRASEAVEGCRAATLACGRRAWARMTLGMLLYTLLLFALLVGCLLSTGAQVPWTVVVAAFVVERLATLAGLTPGGLGLVELGLAGVLATSSTSTPAAVAAAVLLYRGFTFLLEIPVGGLLLLGWLAQRRPYAAGAMA